MMSAAEWLQRRLHEMQVKNPAFSQRAMARFLGVTSGALCEYLSQKRKISLGAAEQIAARLRLGPEESRVWMSLVRQDRTQGRALRKIKALAVELQGLGTEAPEVFSRTFEISPEHLSAAKKTLLELNSRLNELAPKAETASAYSVTVALYPVLRVRRGQGRKQKTAPILT